MSQHLVSELNALKAGLHNSVWQTPTQLSIQKWLLPKYKLNDYFITLTFSPDFKFNVLEATRRVKLFLQKINRKVYGVAYDHKHKALKTDFIFEQNESDGWHFHMLMEQPEPNIRISAPLNNLIKRTWVGMNWNVVVQAQDVQTISDDLEYVISYMTKNVTEKNQSERVGLIV